MLPTQESSPPGAPQGGCTTQNKATGDERSLKSVLLYELPPCVEAIRNGWVVTYQGSAVVGALFASMEASLLTLLKTEGSDGSLLSLRGDTRHAAMRFLLLMTYAALVLNASIVISSLLLLNMLGELPFKNAESPPLAEEAPFRQTMTTKELMAIYRYRGTRLELTTWHWFLSFWAGSACVLGQLCMYIWLHEDRTISALMTASVIFAGIPLFAIIWPFVKAVGQCW